MKTYLKDLTPDEVIRRLKAGEVAKGEDCIIKMVDGVPCIYYGDGTVNFNILIILDKLTEIYFETPDELKLEVGKCYKTRDGRKAFVYSHMGTTWKGVLVEIDGMLSWENDGRVYTSGEHDFDLISEWSDDDVAED